MNQDLCPIVLDSTGRDVHAESERLRAQGPIARIEMPHGVLGWSVTGYCCAARSSWRWCSAAVCRGPR